MKENGGFVSPKDHFEKIRKAFKVEEDDRLISETTKPPEQADQVLKVKYINMDDRQVEIKPEK